MWILFGVGAAVDQSNHNKKMTTQRTKQKHVRLQEYHQDLRSACWCFPLCGPCARSCLRPRYKRVTLEAIDGAFQQLERDLALT